MKYLIKRNFAFGIALAICAACPVLGDSVSTFATGFNVPETISLAPSTFGSYAGQLIISDAGPNSGNGPGAIYAVPVTGGSPTAFSSAANTYVGGVFAPATYGRLSGQYIAGGDTNTATAVLNSVSSSGTATLLSQDTNGVQYNGLAIAPAGFGSAAGKVIATEFNTDGATSAIRIVNPDGSLSSFGSSIPIYAFGDAFAPTGFGSVGGMLLVSDGQSGQIVAVDSSGNERPFATLTLQSQQPGLREIAFAPAGFGQYGGDLFVSISGSTNGGGVAGEVVVLNGNGDIVAVLLQGVAGAPFDPRGYYFLNNSEVLIGDADPSIVSATPSAFAPVPEPASLLLCGTGMVLAALLRRPLKKALSANVRALRLSEARAALSPRF